LQEKWNTPQGQKERQGSAAGAVVVHFCAVAMRATAYYKGWAIVDRVFPESKMLAVGHCPIYE
jgi:hypothetical protein